LRDPHRNIRQPCRIPPTRCESCVCTIKVGRRYSPSLRMLTRMDAKPRRWCDWIHRISTGSPFDQICLARMSRNFHTQSRFRLAPASQAICSCSSASSHRLRSGRRLHRSQSERNRTSFGKRQRGHDAAPCSRLGDHVFGVKLGVTPEGQLLVGEVSLIFAELRTDVTEDGQRIFWMPPAISV